MNQQVEAAGVSLLQVGGDARDAVPAAVQVIWIDRVEIEQIWVPCAWVWVGSPYPHSLDLI